MVVRKSVDQASAGSYSRRTNVFGAQSLTDLVVRKCKPCEGGVALLTDSEARVLMGQLESSWSLSEHADYIESKFNFPVYSRTVAFANAVAWLATNEGHHPELTITYGACRVRFSTTAINGLSENDFICAAKIDRLTEDYRHG